MSCVFRRWDPDVLLGKLSSASYQELLPRTVCDTHCVLSVAPVTVQEESVPIYFLPFLDHGFLFLFFFLSPFLSLVMSCVCVCVPVCVHSWVLETTGKHSLLVDLFHVLTVLH